MRLVQYTCRGDGQQYIGAVTSSNGIIKLTCDKLPYSSVVDLLGAGDAALKTASSIVESPSQHAAVDRSQIKILSPITKCEKIVCIGLNYKDHCSEQNLPLPEEPVVFSKFPSAIVADGDTIILPNKLSQNVDWEVELAVIIGKTGKNVSKVSLLNITSLVKCCQIMGTAVGTVILLYFFHFLLHFYLN